MEDLVEHVVALPGRELALLAPRDRDALLTEEAFEHEEFLPYWAELWPSALALARVVARRPLTGRRVIELGCGLGLPSITAALAGGRVLATDWSHVVALPGRELALLPRLTAAGGEVWLADPGRMTTADFLDPAAAMWRIDAIPHDGPSHVIVHRLRPRAAS